MTSKLHEQTIKNVIKYYEERGYETSRKSFNNGHQRPDLTIIKNGKVILVIEVNINSSDIYSHISSYSKIAPLLVVTKSRKLMNQNKKYFKWLVDNEKFKLKNPVKFMTIETFGKGLWKFF
jgi:hypothetical protein